MLFVRLFGTMCGLFLMGQGVWNFFHGVGPGPCRGLCSLNESLLFYLGQDAFNKLNGTLLVATAIVFIYAVNQACNRMARDRASKRSRKKKK